MGHSASSLRGKTVTACTVWRAFGALSVMACTVRAGRRGAVALACITALSVGPIHGAKAQTRSIQMDHVFTCTAADRVEPARREAICAGFLAVLRQSYPKVAFAPLAEGAVRAPGVELRILRASASGAMLQLAWTDAAGQVTEGREAGLSVMDREMSDDMLRKLFQRALAETPMP